MFVFSKKKMGKFEFNAEAVALKPLKKSYTAADRARIEAEVPKKMSRAEAREKKELEEARKDGTAMPETDEKGEMINPHIPNYIASVPWYIDKDKKPSLFHQHKLKEYGSKSIIFGTFAFVYSINITAVTSNKGSGTSDPNNRDLRLSKLLPYLTQL